MIRYPTMRRKPSLCNLVGNSLNKVQIWGKVKPNRANTNALDLFALCIIRKISIQKFSSEKKCLIRKPVSGLLHMHPIQKISCQLNSSLLSKIEIPLFQVVELVNLGQVEELPTRFFQLTTFNFRVVTAHYYSN